MSGCTLPGDAGAILGGQPGPGHCSGTSAPSGAQSRARKRSFAPRGELRAVGSIIAVDGGSTTDALACGV
jgi:hypothetical protein